MVGVRGSIAALIAMQLSLVGCGTQQIARFEANVGAMRCTKYGGLAEGTPEHRQCVAAYVAGAGRERADTQAATAAVLGASALVWSVKQQARAQAAMMAPPAQQATPLRSNSPRQYALVSQVSDLNYNRTCRYADGTVLGVGKQQCPPAVAGQY